MDYTLNDFQNDCLRTTNRKLDWKDTVTNCIFGASGEVAEISEHFKKHWYHGHALDLDKIKVEIGIDNEDFVFLFCGRIAREKGIAELIEAFELLQRTHPKIKLLY